MKYLVAPTLKKLNKVRIPILIIHSTNDQVSTKANIELLDSKILSISGFYGSLFIFSPDKNADIDITSSSFNTSSISLVVDIPVES